MPIKKRVNIWQVASAAGVSAQTVSRVVNERPDVAPQTRQRVLDIIEQLGYQPNALARSLLHQRSHTLGVVVAKLDHYGPSRTLIGIEQEIRTIGYSLLLDLLPNPEVEEVEQILNRLLSRQVEGIIWAVPEIGSNRNLLEQKTPQLPVPVIYLSMQPRPGLPVISIDNREGGRLATNHLLSEDFQQIGIITGEMGWWEARERLLGWQDALVAAGRKIEAKQIVEGDWSAASGAQGLGCLLERFPEMDAVFVCNDQMALGALQAAPRFDRHIPHQLAIIGFDDTPEAAYYRPALTTIRQQLDEMGARAVQEIIKMIEVNQLNNQEVQPCPILLKPELVIRESAVGKLT
jgi:LacI family transcriptional regulator